MTDWDELLKDLQDRRDTARAMGGSERLEQQRRDERLDARARVDRLLDDDTFVELGTLVGSVHRGVVPPVPADGLVAGHGLIDGRPVLVGAVSAAATASAWASAEPKWVSSTHARFM